MDIDQTNGTTKRKARASVGKEISYKDDSDSDDAAPLVRKTYQFCISSELPLSLFPTGNSAVLTRRVAGQTLQGGSQSGG